MILGVLGTQELIILIVLLIVVTVIYFIYRYGKQKGRLQEMERQIRERKDNK
jgi:hypothetical protein